MNVEAIKTAPGAFCALYLHLARHVNIWNDFIQMVLQMRGRVDDNLKIIRVGLF